jgi:TRAP-type mannitol/chloroaromatic compound transport system permease large subunit
MRQSTGRLARLVVVSLVPPLVLVVVVLGSIFAGIATPTEAGRARRSWGRSRSPRSTAQLTGETLSAPWRRRAASRSWSCSCSSGRRRSRSSSADSTETSGSRVLTSVPGGALGFLLVVNLVVFLLGFFIDFFEIAFIIVPLVVPAAALSGIDLVWLGIVLA